MIAPPITFSPAIIAYGDVLVDVSVQVKTFPKSGQDAIVDDLRLLPGGSAANCAAVAAALGAVVKFIGVTGRDPFGAMLLQDLEQHGVDTRALRQVAGPTAMVITIIERTGERTFLSFRGMAAVVPYGSLPTSIVQAGDCLHISAYTFQTAHSRRTALSLMAAARKVGATISLDPSFHFARRALGSYRQVLDGLDFLFPNEEEASLMARTQDPAQAAKHLCDLGVKTVLLKLGAAGCLIATEAGMCRVPTYSPARVLDTTGAGDAFAGGFLAATLKGCPAEEAACVGHAAAAMVIAEVGGHAGAPTISQLRTFAQEKDDARLLAALARME